MIVQVISLIISAALVTSVIVAFVQLNSIDSKVLAHSKQLNDHGAEFVLVENAVTDLGGVVGGDSHKLAIDDLVLDTSVTTATVYTFPDVESVAADVVLTEGAQTINGIKSFTSPVVLASSLQIATNAGTGKALMSDTLGNASWGQILSSGIFGDGSDGDVILSSNTTLTRDMYYNNLTIQSGVRLNTASYRIFVKRILTFADNTSIISNNGGNGQDGNVTSIPSGSAAGVGAPAGSLGGGGNGGIGDMGPGPSPNPAIVGTGSSNALTTSGGVFAGGAAYSTAPPASATVTANSEGEGGSSILHDLMQVIKLRNLSGTKLTGGAGGTGSSGVSAAVFVPGAGGGGGAGVIMIAAASIVKTGATKGIVEAKGGNGAKTVLPPILGGASVAGSGGGGGGLIVVLTINTVAATAAIDFDVSGGARGMGTFPVSYGVAGSPGLAYCISCTSF